MAFAEVWFSTLSICSARIRRGLRTYCSGSVARRFGGRLVSQTPSCCLATIQRRMKTFVPTGLPDGAVGGQSILFDSLPKLPRNHKNNQNTNHGIKHVWWISGGESTKDSPHFLMERDAPSRNLWWWSPIRSRNASRPFIPARHASRPFMLPRHTSRPLAMTGHVETYPRVWKVNGGVLDPWTVPTVLVLSDPRIAWGDPLRQSLRLPFCFQTPQ